MDRRQFLTTAVSISALGISGCVNQDQQNQTNNGIVNDPDSNGGGNGGGGNGNSNGNGGGNQTNNETENEIPENATIKKYDGDRKLWIKDEEFIRNNEGTQSETIEVKTLLENVGNNSFKALEVKVVFKDENYQVMGSESISMEIQPGESKWFEIPYGGIGSSSSQVKHYLINYNPCDLPCEESKATPDAYYSNDPT